MVPRFAKRQRGAIGLMATLTLGMALLFILLSVDGGRLYLEQRKLQRIADMAALEAAEQGGVCLGAGPQATSLARIAATRNGLSASNTLVASCGYLQTGAGNVRYFVSDNSRSEAIKVEVRNPVSTSVAGGLFSLVEGNFERTTNLHASAVAANPKPPQAMLTLRTTLATVSSTQGALLNGLTQALGGNLTLDVLSWQGIADTQLNLLQYLDQLAVDLDLAAGDYEQVLALDTSATVLLQAAAKVLQQGGAAAEVITNLGNLAASLPVDGLQLGQLLALQSGTLQSGLDANLQLLQLVQGVIQLAASERAATVELPISMLGLVNGNVQVKVIEPQQVSAVGDPRVDDLRVHSAQVRALISLDLPLLTGISPLVNAVADLAGPLTSVLNSLLSLDLSSTLQSVACVLGASCKVLDIQVVSGIEQIQIGLEVAEATSRLRPTPPDAYSCSPKTLTTVTQRSAAKIAIGTFDSATDFFTQGASAVKALPLIDIGTKVCRLQSCSPRVAFAGGGIGVRIDSKVLGSSPSEAPLVFNDPPDIGLSPAYQLMSSDQSQVVASLSDTVGGLYLQAYSPVDGGGLGSVLSLTAGLLDGVKSLLEPLIKNLLSPLLDPLLNALLKVLGIDLATAEVGANLTCGSGHAQLVL